MIMQNQKTLQVLLWLWFGVMTSFVITNVVNIAKLENQVKSLENHNKTLTQRLDFIKLELIK
jgi:hypothetical protein